MTLPLRREKATSDCGELYIELDDLQMTMGDPLGGVSPLSSRSPVPDITTPQSHSNHVSGNSANSAAAHNGEASTSGLITEVANQMDLMSLDTPDPSRRGLDGASPTTSPTPTTSTGGSGGERVGVGAASLTATVGMASVGGGGRGSGTNSPATPSAPAVSHSPQPPQAQNTSRSVRVRIACHLWFSKQSYPMTWPSS